jgi:DNA repair protein RecO (recombination protein O)
MSAEKSLAIVLRTIEFSETSVVATLFTEQFGKISALAKGARRPKGPFESALDLLAVVRIVFLHKSSDALDLLTEAKLERRFRAAARDLSRLYAGYYVAELLTELTDAGDPHAELFSAADRTLARLDSDAPVAPTVLDFELTALQLLGHLPSLHDCVGCGNPVEGVGRIAFGLVVGGVLCSTCRPGQRQVVSISAPALVAMRKLTEENENAELMDLEPKVRGELRGILSSYLAHLLGHKPKMHDYLKTLV